MKLTDIFFRTLSLHSEGKGDQEGHEGKTQEGWLQRNWNYCDTFLLFHRRLPSFTVDAARWLRLTTTGWVHGAHQCDTLERELWTPPSEWPIYSDRRQPPIKIWNDWLQYPNWTDGRQRGLIWVRSTWLAQEGSRGDGTITCNNCTWVRSVSNWNWSDWKPLLEIELVRSSKPMTIQYKVGKPKLHFNDCLH